MNLCRNSYLEFKPVLAFMWMHTHVDITPKLSFWSLYKFSFCSLSAKLYSIQPDFSYLLFVNLFSIFSIINVWALCALLFYILHNQSTNIVVAIRYNADTSLVVLSVRFNLNVHLRLCRLIECSLICHLKRIIIFVTVFAQLA